MATQVFRGLRYINLLRASTLMQDTSTDDQKVVNDKHALKLGMIHAGDVVLQGVSGSKTFNRKDLSDLLERRRVFKNYDVIVVYDSSRLTRGGAAHAFSIRRDFAKENVMILSVMDPIPEGDFKEVIQSVIDTQNYLAAKKISGFVTRGIYDAVKNGIVEKHGASPLGVDRMYYDSNGNGILRLCYRPGGVRKLIEVASGKTLKKLRRGEQPVAAHLLSQGETVRLVFGDPRIVEAVREAFRLRYRQGWGYTRIGKYLAEQGIKPLRAASWSDGSVRDIVMNPTFLGWSLFLQLKCGLHHHAAADRPVERFINQAELEKLGRQDVPRERRPLEDMMVVQHRELAGFIGEEDADVRKAAESVIRQYFSDWETKKRVEGVKPSVRNHNSQARTRYFLRDVLRDKHYSRKFCGLTHGREGAYRDYMCNSVIEFEKRDRPLPTTCRAEPLERAVIEVLKAVFSDMKDIEQRIAVVAARIIAEQPDAVERARLHELLVENKKTMRQLQNTFTADELADNPERVAELRDERKRVEKRLAIAEAAQVKLDVAKLTTDIMEGLRAFDTQLDGDGYERLRMLVNTVCPRITIDLDKYEAEVTVALPTILLWSPSSDWRMMCGTLTREVLSQGIAHRDSWLILGVHHLKPTNWTPPTKLGRTKPTVYESFRIDDQPPQQEQRRAA